MSGILYGCQTYPWKMAGGRYEGDIAHMAAVTAEAGFQGIEAEISMLGEWFEDPDRLAEELTRRGLALAAVVLHQSWEEERETEEEEWLTKKTVEFVRRFPRTKIMVSHHAGREKRPEGEALRERRKRLISCMDSVARRAGEAGIVTCFHPNSSANSLFRTREDYEILFDLLSRTAVGYAPDIGHIVNGGMDPMEVLRTGRELIRHVHFKDRKAGGGWAVMGEGDIDYESVVRYLEQTEYTGWIMVEDESEKAAADSDGVVLADGRYMARFREKAAEAGGLPE